MTLGPTIPATLTETVHAYTLQRTLYNQPLLLFPLSPLRTLPPFLSPLPPLPPDG